MALNQVQRDFINGAARPHMEQIVKALHIMDVFVQDYDALQASADAIPQDATVLTDGASGTDARTDAPQLTGAQVKTLRDKSAAMVATVSGAEKQVLIGKMVRPLADVLKV